MPAPLSPFAERLGNLSHLEDGASEVPTTPPLRHEGANLAWCPLLAEESTKNMCGDVVCRGCAYLDEEYEYQDWLCTVCSEDETKEPYWSDGKCYECGFYSSILVLVSR